MMEKTPKEMASDLYTEFLAILSAGTGYSTMPGTEGYSTDNRFLATLCVKLTCDKLIAERDRAVEIAYSFHERSRKDYESKKAAGSDVAFVSQCVADECHFIGNAISGENALSIVLDKKSYWEQVKEEADKR